MNDQPSAAADELPRALDALRERGAGSRDPVRFRLLQALVASPAAARQRTLVLQLLADCRRVVERPAAPAARRPLADLLAALAPDQEAPPPGASNTAVAAARAVADLRAVSEHRQAWARLGVERRLLQALAQVPGQAGPLNTQRLLHQALRAMHRASPGHLQHFVQHVEALLWLDAAGLPLDARPPRPPAAGSTAPQSRRRRHARPGGQQ